MAGGVNSSLQAFAAQFSRIIAAITTCKTSCAGLQYVPTLCQSQHRNPLHLCYCAAGSANEHGPAAHLWAAGVADTCSTDCAQAPDRWVGAQQRASSSSSSLYKARPLNAGVANR